MAASCPHISRHQRLGLSAHQCICPFVRQLFACPPATKESYARLFDCSRVFYAPARTFCAHLFALARTHIAFMLSKWHTPAMNSPENSPQNVPVVDEHASESAAAARDFRSPLSDLPFIDGLRPASPSSIPDDEACFALWDKYVMLPNIRQHSLLVAHIATELARRAIAQGIAVDEQAVRASALLHDIAKSYCVRHGGSHAQLGACWTVAETRNHALAQGVMMHVYWPWALPQGQGICALPFLVMYADKRVKHDVCVSLSERYDDLLVRYGRSDAERRAVLAAFEQGKTIERALGAQLGCALHEDSFDCGRLVQ